MFSLKYSFFFSTKTCTFLLLHFMVKPIIHWWTLCRAVILNRLIYLFCSVSRSSTAMTYLCYASIIKHVPLKRGLRCWRSWEGCGGRTWRKKNKKKRPAPNKNADLDLGDPVCAISVYSMKNIHANILTRGRFHHNKRQEKLLFFLKTTTNSTFLCGCLGKPFMWLNVNISHNQT